MELTDKSVKHWFSTEMLVAYHFSLQEYIVNVPLSPCSYDLAIDIGTKIVRIQVKKALFRKQRERPQGLGDRDHWLVLLTKKKRIHGAHGAMHHRRISAEEFDYLAVVCEDSAVYVIPKSLLVSANDPSLLFRLIQIKPALESGRADSMKAGSRWEPYKNVFTLS